MTEDPSGRTAEDLAGRVERAFRDAFGVAPLLVRSPGRVNLIGEHTDYNEGFVLPAAVDKAICFRRRPQDGNDGTLRGFRPRHRATSSRSPGRPRSPLGWPNYLLGVVDQLNRLGAPVGGFACVFGGDIPIGSGCPPRPPSKAAWPSP